MSHPEIIAENKEKQSRALWVSYDLDDTFFNIIDPSLTIFNERYGTNLTPNDINEFWYIPDFLRKLGKSEEEIEAFRDEVYRSLENPKVYVKSRPNPGAIEVARGIYRHGHISLVLTSRPPGFELIIEKQFKAVGIGWIAGDWVEGGNILIRDKEYWENMSTEEFKLRAIRGDFPYGKYKDFPGIDAHLDDMGELLFYPLAAEVRDKLFILGQNYNLEIVPTENLVNNWWVFYKVIRSLARGEKFSPACVAQY